MTTTSKQHVEPAWTDRNNAVNLKIPKQKFLATAWCSRERTLDILARVLAFLGFLLREGTTGRKDLYLHNYPRRRRGWGVEGGLEGKGKGRREEEGKEEGLGEGRKGGEGVEGKGEEGEREGQGKGREGVEKKEGKGDNIFITIIMIFLLY